MNITRALTILADLSEVARVRIFVANLAAELGFSDERQFDIQVATSEACANAIEHSPSGAAVVLRSFAYKDRLQIEVDGEGEFELPQALSERRHRGLGLPLMAKLSDHLALYSNKEGHSVVSLTFCLPAANGDRLCLSSPAQVETALRESDARRRRETEELRVLYESAPVGIGLLGRDLRYIRVNECLADMHGLTAQDHVGRTVREILPGMADELESLLRPILQTGEGVIDLQLVGEAPSRPGQEQVWLQRWLPICGDSGDVEALSVVALDITGRAEAIGAGTPPCPETG